MFNLQIRKTKSYSALFMRYGRVIKTKRTFCYRLKKNIFAEKSGKSTITRRMLVPGKKVVYVHKRRNKSQISFISIHSRISKIKKKLRTFTVKKENLKKISKKYQINKLIKKNMNFLAKRNKINYKECGVILCFKENSMDDVSKKSGPASSSTIGISLNLRNGNSSHKLSPPTPQVSVDTQPFLTCDPSPPSIRISAKSPEKLLGKESRTFLDFSTPPDQIKFERNSRSSSVSSQDINSILSITIKEEWKKITSSPKKTKQIPIADFPRTRRSKELAAAQEVKQIEKVYQINEDHLVILHSLREPRIVLERIDSHPAYIKAMKDLYEEEKDEEEEFVHPPEVCEDDPFGCPFCNRVYKREHHLKFHISTHFTKKELELEEPEIQEFKIEAPQPVEEEIDFGNTKAYLRRLYCAQIGCNKSYLGLTGIKYHIRKAHPEVFARTLQSDVKQENGEDAKPKVNEPSYHVFSRGRFLCFICNKPFKNIFNLKKHRIVHSEERPFVCTHCDKKFKEEHNLKKHLDIHLRPFHCPYCERTYVLETDLDEHVKIHPFTLDGKFQCHECSLFFPSVKDLSQHKYRMHSTIKSFKCSVCDQAFKFKLALIRHERRFHRQGCEQVRSENRNEWPCDVCKKIFTYRCHMIKHKKVHQRTFKCTKCHLSFNMMASLESHMTLHPNDNGEFECAVCGQSFLERKKMILHKYKHLHSKSLNNGGDSRSSGSPNLRVGPFQCSICPRTFNQQAHLDSHINFHPEPDGTYKCKICKNSKTFSKINYLKTHLQRHANGFIEGKRRFSLNVGDFPCKLCGRFFRFKCFLEYHLKTHQREFKCKLCPKSFNFLKNLEIHENQHSTNVDGTFPCKICGKTFLKYRFLKFHLKRHENGTLPLKRSHTFRKGNSYTPGETKCKLCGKQFKYNCNLVAHLKTHLRAYKCPICPRTFNHLINLQEHERCHPDTDGRFNCKLCDKTFRKQTYLKNHQRVHLKQFQCTKCSKSFDHLILLQDHLLTHPESEDGRFVCKICQKTFKKLDYLKQHQIVHSGARNFICTMCNKAFRYATNLNVHMKTHENTPFHCLICPKKFKLESERQEHLDNHPAMKEKKVPRLAGNREDFECDFCSKSFENANQLRRHRLTHSMKRSFKCPTCNKTFKLSQHLKNHEMSHSDARNLKCEICGLTFKFARNMGTHMKFHKNNDQFIPESAADLLALPPMPALLAIPGTSKSSDFPEYPDLIEIPDFSMSLELRLIEEMDVVDLTSD